MPKEINYLILPSPMQAGMKSYIEDRCPPGDFLYFILCNDFVRAAEHADQVNLMSLLEYIRFLLYQAPRGCWGSKAAVEAWLNPTEEGEAESAE